MAGKLSGSAIQSNTITVTQLSTTTVTTIVNQTGPRVTSLVYPGNDTAGNTVGGQTVYINGSGFETNNAIYINGNAVPSKSFISASNLSFTTPALSAGIYPVYVINTDSGSTAIFVPGYIASAEPTWVTSAGSLNSAQDESSTWSYSLSATGDAPITYALADGSSLPTGISLAANGLVSGTLSSPPGTETTYTFSVVATDAQNQDSTRQFTVTTTSGEGLLFANNVLLIHADGTNNKNNHTFLDSSNNNFTITRYGNATQGSYSPFSQTGWSNYFDGSGDYLTAPDSTAYDFGTSDFTIEAWIYPTTSSGVRILIGQYSGSDGFSLELTNTNTLTLWLEGSTIATSTGTVTINAWNHVAASRSGTALKLFINGVVDGTATNSTNVSGSTSSLYISSSASTPGAGVFTGYISNVRIVKGTAVYTSAFTPPTSPLTAITNTALLTCQSNRFIDNSTNAFTITRNGDVSVQPFSPFISTSAYSTANVGGSGYFDGTDDYLTAATGSACNLNTGDFTIELWFYPTTVASQSLTQQGEASWRINLDGSNRIQYAAGGANRINGSILYAINQWHHVAVVANGATTTLYVNGVSAGTTTSRPSNVTTDAVIGINTAGVGNVWPFLGYISNVRIVKGTAVYTGAFTPPTAPLTNIANTSLLCNFTNAGIFDQTAKNIIETQGDAKITTSVYKYGTGSIAFDGTGDRLVIPTNKNLDMTNNFTIEMWIYLTTLPTYSVLFDTSANGTAGSAMTELWVESNGNVVYYARGSSILTTNTNNLITPNAWHHIALVKNETSQVLYVNGVSRASATSSTLPNSGYSWYIGDRPASAGSGQYPITGYIDDLRITKGYARYTSNFTPPAAAFKDK